MSILRGITVESGPFEESGRCQNAVQIHAGSQISNLNFLLEPSLFVHEDVN